MASGCGVVTPNEVEALICGTLAVFSFGLALGMQISRRIYNDGARR